MKKYFNNFVIIAAMLPYLINFSYAHKNVDTKYISIKIKKNTLESIFTKLQKFSAKHKISNQQKKVFYNKAKKSPKKIYTNFFKTNKCNNKKNLRFLIFGNRCKPLINQSNKHFAQKKESNYSLKKPTVAPYSLPIKKLKMDSACSLHCIQIIRKYERAYGIPKNTLHAIALVESGTSCKGYPPTMRHPWPWTVFAAGSNLPGMHFATKQEARQFIRNQWFRGQTNIDIGCIQVNMTHHKHAFASLDDALEPDKNIHYAAKYLHQKYKQVNNWNKAIGLYHSSDKTRGQKYFSKVMDAKREIAKHPVILAQMQTKIAHQKTSKKM